MVMDYMSSPGYRFRMPDGTEWLIALDGSRVRTATPLEVASTFGTTPDGWNAGGTAYPSQMVRDARSRRMDLEVRRLASSAGGGVITPDSNGQIGNMHLFTVADGDKPMRQTPLVGTYLGTNGGDGQATGYIEANGKVYLATMSPNLPMAVAAAPGWSLRLSGDWYTS
jgi:hypothetical protein